MAKKQLSLEDVLNYVETLPYAQFKGVVEHYSQKQSGDFSNTLNQLVVSWKDWKKKLVYMHKDDYVEITERIPLL